MVWARFEFAAINIDGLIVCYIVGNTLHLYYKCGAKFDLDTTDGPGALDRLVKMIEINQEGIEDASANTKSK